MYAWKSDRLQCPVCGSSRIWKNGFKYGVQTYLCLDCSRRFNDPKQKPVIKFKIKKNIISQSVEKLDSRPDFAQVSIGQFDSAIKKTLNDSSFSIREDVSSHLGSHESILGKNINGFASAVVNVNCVSPLKACIHELSMYSLEQSYVLIDFACSRTDFFFLAENIWAHPFNNERS